MGGGASREVLTNSYNSIITQSLMQSSTSCQDLIDLEQDINISCEGGNSPETWYEAQPACVECFESVLKSQEANHAMIKRSWNKEKGHAPINTSYSQEMINWYNMMNQQCLYRCKACVFSDISQASTFKWKAGCTDTQNVSQKFSSALKGNLTQSLTDNQVSNRPFRLRSLRKR